MKKLICMLLALVLMMGAMVLPASAEEAAGEIYKLPGGYADYIGMGGGLIVCAKAVYDPVLEMETLKYGAIDNTGKTVVPFEYDVATAPNDEGEFVVTKINYPEDLDEEFKTYEMFDSYLVDPSGKCIDVSTAYIKGILSDNEFTVISGAVLNNDLICLAFLYEDTDSLTVRIYNMNNKQLIDESFVNVNYDEPNMGFPKHIITKDLDYRVYLGNLSYVTHEDNGIHHLLQSYEFGDYIAVGDTFAYYYAYNPSTYEILSIWHYDRQEGKITNLCEKYNFSPEDIAGIFCKADANSVMLDPGKLVFLNEDGKYAYVDDYNDINTGFIFDGVFPDFSDGYFCAVIDGKYTYYTTDGKPTDRYFAENINFSSGTSFVTDESGDTYAIDTEFNRVSDDAIALDSETSMYEYKDGVLVTLGNNFEFYAYTSDADYSIFGDVNGDEKVDVADIIKLKSIVMAEEELPAADLNADTKVDVQDIITLKALIMSI